METAIGNKIKDIAVQNAEADWYENPNHWLNLQKEDQLLI